MRSANVSQFAMVPRNDVPRSVFQAEQTLKTTFNASDLIPIYLDEILPGDSVKLRLMAFCRLAPVIYPVMDNLHLDTFFFFVPCRLVWDNFKKMMGERSGPGGSTTYLVPQVNSPAAGYPVGSIYDYFGLPTVGQMDGASTGMSINSLPFRAYQLIWNEWFRDQNIHDEVFINKGDGPNGHADYALLKRGKRHDYFTTCLPWPEKPTSLDMTEGFSSKGGAPVSGLGAPNTTSTGAANSLYESGNPSLVDYASSKALYDAAAGNQVFMRLDSDGFPDVRVTINAMRQAFQVQKLLERDARGGSRYVEIVRSHFGVTSPDARLQRPEYLGGGSSPININPVAQTSASGVSGSTTPLGQLGGIGSGLAQNHGFSQSFTEHGYIIGLANVRADLTYQQGIHKMWSRRTKFDFYWPALSQLGEQAVLRQEIYARGIGNQDTVVFGYQERWAEYRHKPSRITGLFRSTTAGTLDAWHLAERFTAIPVLGSTFINDNTPMQRVLAAGALADKQQILFDGLFSVRMVRPIPARSIPGLGDRF